MKYNININQLALNEIAPNLKIVDAAILDYLIVICNSKSEKVEEQRIKEKGETWTWVDMGSLLKDMPLLDLSSRSSLTPRFKKIAENGFIHLKKKRVSGHERLFVKLDRLVESLFVKLDGPVRETGRAFEKPVRETGPTINTTISDTNTRTREALAELFNEFWKEYPKKIAKSECEKKWFKLTTLEALAIVEDVKNRKLKDTNWIDGYSPHPTTYLNQKRWNDEVLTNRPGRSNMGSDTPYIKGKYSNIKVTTIKNVIKPKE